MATALTIAGSDAGGGAGVQADLKTFAAHGVYGTTAITAVTAQNTVAVESVLALPPEMVVAQITAVARDIGADAVKTGMLANAAIGRAVAAALESLRLGPLVLDPVMVAKSGDALLEADGIAALKTVLLPLAFIVTPNAPEAEILADMRVRSVADAREAARRIHTLGAAAVVVKGGHIPGDESSDVLFDGRAYTEFRAPRVASRNTHGTGCTFASAIAAQLALGRPLIDAVRLAKTYVTGAIEHGLPIGRGHGPLDHFWEFRRRT